MMNIPIEHIATGGTIDSQWSPEDDGAIPADFSVVGQYFDFLAANNFPKVDSSTVILKDSRQVTIGDKDAIAQRVAESRYPRSLVTSGTYLMREIGERIQRHNMAKHFDRFGHRVVVTPALIPLDGFMMSDGGFNLGMSLAAFDNKEAGDNNVLGVVNGMIAPIHLLEKDLTTATFEPLDSSQSLLGYGYYNLVPAGGTIDFEISSTDGLEPATDTAIPNFLRHNVRSNVKFETTPPILKDSRNLTPEDMDLIVDILRESDAEHIIVTAGLLRMAELKRVIQEGLHTPTDCERKIILTGSKFILRMAASAENKTFTDATFNLGYAHGRLGDVTPGVHIAVTGKVLEEQEDPIDLCYSKDELDKLIRTE